MGSGDRNKLGQILDCDIVNRICDILLPLAGSKDMVVWGPSNNGKFSVNSATWIQMEDMGACSSPKLLNRIWKQVSPLKIKLFAWSLIKEKLQTRKRLNKFITTSDDKCPLCNSHMEYQDHLFLHCSYAKQVWNCSNDASLLNADSNITVNQWLNGLSHSNKNTLSSLSKALAICWQIWNDRNASILKKEKMFHYRSFTNAMSIVDDYFKENSGQTEKTKSANEYNVISWQWPMAPYVKINFNGSITN